MHRAIILLLWLLVPCEVLAQNQYIAAARPSIGMELKPIAPIQPGKLATVIVRLIRMEDGKLIEPKDLKDGERFPVLINDLSLSDYYHVLAYPAGKSGEYYFSFTPKNNFYRVWADLTPMVTDKREYVLAEMGKRPDFRSTIIQQQVLNGTAEDLMFDLAFDQAPITGRTITATLTVTDKKDKPFKRLQPVMGGFAHMAGFYDDITTIFQAYPLGPQPATSLEEGGPAMSFHLVPPKAGFVRLYVQARAKGKDLFIPFGFAVKEAEPDLGYQAK